MGSRASKKVFQVDISVEAHSLPQERSLMSPLVVSSTTSVSSICEPASYSLVSSRPMGLRIISVSLAVTPSNSMSAVSRRTP